MRSRRATARDRGHGSDIAVPASGSPRSIMTRRASLSIADSARPCAKGNSPRTATMPLRPRCSATALSISARVHHSERNAASSVASARGRCNCRATSTAVHAGVVAQTSGCPSQRYAGALMDHQTDRRTHPYPGSRMCTGGGAHAGNRVPAHEGVEFSQAAQQIWLLGRINSIPNADKAA